jgi:hypothetical protein
MLYLYGGVGADEEERRELDRTLLRKPPKSLANGNEPLNLSWRATDGLIIL